MNKIKILNTKTRDFSKDLMAYFLSKDCEVIHCPTIQIQPIILDSIDVLVNAQFIIYVSVNAVRCAKDLVIDLLKKVEENQRYIVVGDATQQELIKLGVKDIIVARPHNSEGILSLSYLQNIGGKKIVLVKGAGGRKLLSDTLKARGGIVSELVTYQRAMPENNKYKLRKLIEFAQISYIYCASIEGIKNLLFMLGSLSFNVSTIKLIVVSSRQLKYAKSKGFVTVLLCKGTGSAETKDLFEKLLK